MAARCWPSAGRWRRQSRPAPSKPAQLRKPSPRSARGRPRPWTDSAEFRQRTWTWNYGCVPRRADGQSTSDNGSETCAETPYETCLSILYTHNTHMSQSANARFRFFVFCSIKTRNKLVKEHTAHTHTGEDVTCALFSNPVYDVFI